MNRITNLFFIAGLAATPLGCATTGAGSGNRNPCSIVNTKKTDFGVEREYHKMLSIWVPASELQFLDSGDKKTLNVMFGAQGLHHDTIAKGTPVKFSIGERVVTVPLSVDSEPTMNAAGTMMYTMWKAVFPLEKLRKTIAVEGLHAVRFEIAGSDYDIKVDAKQATQVQKAAACMSDDDVDMTQAKTP